MLGEEPGSVRRGVLPHHGEGAVAELEASSRAELLQRFPVGVQSGNTARWPLQAVDIAEDEGRGIQAAREQCRPEVEAELRLGRVDRRGVLALQKSRRLNTSTRFFDVTGSGQAADVTGPIAASMSAIHRVGPDHAVDGAEDGFLPDPHRDVGRGRHVGRVVRRPHRRAHPEGPVASGHIGGRPRGHDRHVADRIERGEVETSVFRLEHADEAKVSAGAPRGGEVLEASM